MADFTALKTAIQNAIKQNGNNAITGNLLQDILISMVSTLGDSAINGLSSSLSTETTNRQNADGTLQSAINTINTKLSDGYTYLGIATPTTNPSTTSGKVFYIATTAGTYTNFLNSSSQPLVLTQGINILKYNGTSWSVEQLWSVDDVPTAGSNNLVKSGGVLDSIIKDGSAFDLSAYNSGATYADLNAALTALNALPAAYKNGGMSMKFVQTSDNNYVQFRYKGAEVSGNPNPFLNTVNWQKQGGEIRIKQNINDTYPEWRPNTQYAVGDIVSNLNENWICNTAHTSFGSSVTLLAGYWDSYNNNGIDTIESEENIINVLDSNRFIHLIGFGSNGVEYYSNANIGDYFYNTTIKRIYRFVSKHEPMSVNDIDVIPFIEGSLYEYEGNFFKWDKTKKDLILFAKEDISGITSEKTLPTFIISELSSNNCKITVPTTFIIVTDIDNVYTLTEQEITFTRYQGNFKLVYNIEDGNISVINSSGIITPSMLIIGQFSIDSGKYITSIATKCNYILNRQQYTKNLLSIADLNRTLYYPIICYNSAFMFIDASGFKTGDFVDSTTTGYNAIIYNVKNISSLVIENEYQLNIHVLGYSNIPSRETFTEELTISNNVINIPNNVNYIGISISSSSNISNIRIRGPFTSELKSDANPLYGKKLSIMGDSISTFSGYIPNGNVTFYPSGTVTSVEQTWWKKLLNSTGMILEVNQSWSGSRITNGRGTTSMFCNPDRYESLGNPDIIIVLGGINDFAQGNPDCPLGSYIYDNTIKDLQYFRQAYQYLVEKLQEIYPNALLYICVPSQGNFSLFDDNTAGWSQQDLWNTIREVGDMYGIQVIDLSKCGINHYNYTNYLLDRVHPNENGMNLISLLIKEKLLGS